VYSKVWAGELAAKHIQVKVQIFVANSGGGTLSYQWRSTDGTIT